MPKAVGQEMVEDQKPGSVKALPAQRKPAKGVDSATAAAEVTRRLEAKDKR